MAAITDDFPHHGEHLANDDKQASFTIALLAALVSVLAILGMSITLYV